MTELEKNIRPEFKWPALSGSCDDLGGDILSQARRRARTLLEEAQEEAGRIRKNAERAAGLAVEEARRRGRAEFAEEARRCAEVLLRIQKEAEGLPRSWREELEGQVLRLSTRIAGKIVRRELRSRVDATLDIVRAGLRLLPDHVDVRVRVNHGDLGKWTGAGLLEEGLAGQFEPSARIPAGSFEIRSALGYVDGSIQRQIARIRRFLAPDANTIPEGVRHGGPAGTAAPSADTIPEGVRHGGPAGTAVPDKEAQGGF